MSESSRIVRFGVFEADLGAFELRKQGRIIPLQRQPFDLLVALLEHPNDVISRDALRQRLWPDHITVDFDQSLNKCVTKLRDALGDSATHPRYIETVPRRGYRFIAAVEAAVVPLRDASIALPSEPVRESLPPPSARPVSLLSIVALSMLVLAPWWFINAQWRSLIEPETSSPVASAAGTPSTSSVSANSSEASRHDDYARGKVALTRRSEEGLRSAIELFGRAVSIDPRHDGALVGLADAWGLLASHGMDEPRSAMVRAREFANRALTINPESADAHRALGRITMIGDWDWTIAEWHFRRALEIRESDPLTHRWFAYLLSATARHADAERHARRAVDLDPLSINAATGLGYVLYAARRFNDAEAVLRRVIEVDPEYTQARRDLGRVLAMQGRYREALAECERVLRLTGGSSVTLAEAAWVYGRSGDPGGAGRLLAQLRARASAKYVPDDSLALALWASGERDVAVATLERAFEARLPMLAYLAVDPMWDEQRAIPKVKALAEAVRGNQGRAPGHPSVNGR